MFNVLYVRILNLSRFRAIENANLNVSRMNDRGRYSPEIPRGSPGGSGYSISSEQLLEQADEDSRVAAYSLTPSLFYQPETVAMRLVVRTIV